jgi:hypothetical protein
MTKKGLTKKGIERVVIKYKIFILIMFITIVFYSCKYKKEDLFIYKQYELGINQAKQNSKKIFLIFDFYGNQTNSTKKLLQNQNVKLALQDFVIIQLMVDGADSTSKANATLQINIFKSRNQPMYYILDKEGQVLLGPKGYDSHPNILAFINSIK